MGSVHLELLTWYFMNVEHSFRYLLLASIAISVASVGSLQDLVEMVRWNMKMISSVPKRSYLVGQL